VIHSPKPSWSKSLKLRGPEEDNLDKAHRYISGRYQDQQGDKNIPVEFASLRFIGIEKCFFPSSSTVLPYPMIE
jgi:hypothetical protein